MSYGGFKFTKTPSWSTEEKRVREKEEEEEEEAREKRREKERKELIDLHIKDMEDLDEKLNKLKEHRAEVQKAIAEVLYTVREKTSWFEMKLFRFDMEDAKEEEFECPIGAGDFKEDILSSYRHWCERTHPPKNKKV